MGSPTTAVRPSGYRVYERPVSGVVHVVFDVVMPVCGAFRFTKAHFKVCIVSSLHIARNMDGIQ